MGVTIRGLRDEDVPAAVLVALEGGSPDADAEYVSFVASAGRLLVAVDDRLVVGVAGSVPLGDATMVTDLFVAESCRGLGVGGRLLAAVTDGAWRRCTFSSDHPAALPAYARLGMTPRWRLLTMRGIATGGAGPERAVRGGWRHERADLVAYFAGRGADVAPDVVVLRGATTTVLRLVSDAPTAVLEQMLATEPAGHPVELSVPEHDPLVAWLAAHGFEIVDADVFCATDGVELDPRARCVHRGLC
ncbi:MAG: Acetyltransferase domain [Actinomycetota bacterium]